MRQSRLALALIAVTLGTAADRQRVPDAVPTGPAVSCIPLTQIRESRVRDDRTIDFIMSGHRTYRVTLPLGCPELGFEERFAYATSLNQLCSNDIITVLQSPGLSRGASCGLSPFQPVTLAKR